MRSTFRHHGQRDAIETLAALRENGRSVPREVSVVGVDNHPLAEATALTTVAQQPASIGISATELLLEQLDGAAPVRQLTTPTHLARRGTTASCPS